MKKLILTPIAGKHKKKYVIKAKFMHGDADAYTHEDHTCKNEADFIRIMTEFDSLNLYDENVVNDWVEKNFGEDFAPYDITVNDSWKAQLRSLEGFYFDDNRNKFKAELK